MVRSRPLVCCIPYGLPSMTTPITGQCERDVGAEMQMTRSAARSRRVVAGRSCGRGVVPITGTRVSTAIATRNLLSGDDLRVRAVEDRAVVQQVGLHDGSPMSPLSPRPFPALLTFPWVGSNSR